MGIRSLAKQIQSSFNKSLHSHELLPQGLVFFKAYRSLSMPVFQESYQVLSYDFEVFVSNMAATLFNCRDL